MAIALRKIFARQPDSTPPNLGILIDKRAFTARRLLLLESLYDDLVDIDPIGSVDKETLEHELGRPELDKTYSKVILWSLSQYDKILYLDADTLPNTSSSRTVVDLLKLDFPRNKILAASDSGFPDIFNSGMFVLRPDSSDFSQLRQLAQSADPTVSFDGADQGLLNQYFNPNPDWVSELLDAGLTNVQDVPGHATSLWIKLPFLYNVTPSAQYEYFPAFKHFTGNLSNTPHIGADGGLSNPGLYPYVAETLSRYHSAAASYFTSGSAFGARSQVSLVHYIGPYKPWSSLPQDRVYDEWWQHWFSQFHDTIENVLGTQKPPSVEVAEMAEVQENEAEPQMYDAPIAFDPATLCDPKNYEHIPDLIRTSADAQWDPSSAPPPAPEPGYHSNFEVKQFTNAWNEVLRGSNPPERSPSPVHVEDDKGEYGYHPSQRAERVFDSSRDIKIHHSLYKEVADVPEVEQEEPKDESVALIEERLEELGFVETVVEMDPEINEEEHFTHGAAEVFPWERAQRRPERVFDW